MRFLHCSDVHLTTDYFSRPKWPLGWRRWLVLLELGPGGRAKQYAEASTTLKQITADAQRHNVDHLIVSGDLTAYSMEEEFIAAKDALAPWVDKPERCTVIPGNHDTYTPGARADRRFERYFGHLLDSDLPEYAREGPFPFVRLLGEQVAVVGLCSARVPPAPGFSYGLVGKRQLEGLAALVEDPKLRGRAVLVVVHHAPLTKRGGKDKPLHRLLDAQRLLQLLPGERFAVLHGHIHHRYHHQATATRPHLFGAGSSTMRGREGYWLIDVDGGKVLGAKRALPGL